MRTFRFILLSITAILLITSCGPTLYMPNRPYGYRPDFQRTYADKSQYRPSHYRNFLQRNSQYLNDKNKTASATPTYTNAVYQQPVVVDPDAGRSDEVYLVKNYLNTHAKTKKSVYHTTYTTSYNDNGDVTTTYTTDYVGPKKEEQYWKEVQREQRKMYKESRKKKKVKYVAPPQEDEDDEEEN